MTEHYEVLLKKKIKLLAEISQLTQQNAKLDALISEVDVIIEQNKETHA